jgi:hypothetical protein
MLLQLEPVNGIVIFLNETKILTSTLYKFNGFLSSTFVLVDVFLFDVISVNVFIIEIFVLVDVFYI